MNKKSWKEILDAVPTTLKKMSLVAFNMDMMKDPEDALCSWDVSPERLDQWERNHFKRLVETVAQETGADPAQIADKDRRTDEQQQALLLASAREQIRRMDAFNASNWMQAYKVLDALTPEYNAEPADGVYSMQEVTLLYFFATHPDIRPSDKAALTDANIKELQDFFGRIDAFYMAHKGDDDREILVNFLEQELAEIAPDIVESVRLKDFDFPVDKVNKHIWRLLEEHSKGDQIAFDVSARASKDPVLIYYAISFDELENQGITITKRLTAFEKRVYIAAGALYAIKGQKPFTYTELYYAMGYTGKPGSNDLEKLAAAITKMGGARIYVDNQQEIAAKYHYPRFRYDGYLLPMERVTAIVDGKITDAAIHLFREPPLIAFARQREQITQINIKLLQSPASKTEANIALEDYLIERIAQARNERRKLEKKRCKTDEERRKKAEALDKDPRILFATLYEHANITTVKQKQRAPEKVKRILEHYKACSFIRDFEIDATGVTITL